MSFRLGMFWQDFPLECLRFPRLKGQLTLDFNWRLSQTCFQMMTTGKLREFWKIGKKNLRNLMSYEIYCINQNVGRIEATIKNFKMLYRKIYVLIFALYHESLGSTSLQMQPIIKHTTVNTTPPPTNEMKLWLCKLYILDPSYLHK